MTHRAYVGIGTNLGDRERNVERALEALGNAGSVRAVSSFYRSTPWGKIDQPWFLNAVAELSTSQSPRELLTALLSIERRLGRTPAERWGPRIIDLDLLLYDDLTIDEEDLRVPHPRLRERAFVLVPLAELDERFAAWRDALDASERAGVVNYARPRCGLTPGESVRPMPERKGALAARIEALAEFLATSDAIRVSISRNGEEIEVVRRAAAGAAPASSEHPQAAASQRVDAISADIVGIFALARPAPIEGEALEGDRELGYIEALGIRTPVRSLGGGRLLSIAAEDGAPVEYGQPLFLVARA